MDIAVTGSSGFIGSALLPALRTAGHRPVALVRRPPTTGADELHWDPSSGKIDTTALSGIDAVINLAGVGIADRRWSKTQRAAIHDSRTRGTELLASTLAALPTPPTRLISGSAVGYYGEQGNTVITEDASAGAGFLASVCVDWELAAQPAIDAGIRTAFARTGIVLASKGGALGKQLPLFRLGLGGRLGSGSQWVSWITLGDEVRALIHLLDSEVSGPVNLTAPHPVTNLAFTKALGKQLGRPTILPIPKFAPALLLGKDLAEQLLFSSVRAVPNALLADGFTFEANTIELAFSQLLGKDRSHG